MRIVWLKNVKKLKILILCILLFIGLWKEFIENIFAFCVRKQVFSLYARKS